MKTLQKYLPLLFILIIWFIFSFPYFSQGRVPFPSSYQVNHFPPWSSYEKYWGPVKNGAMPDIIDQIYPWRHFTFEELRSGRMPLWNPYSFSGNPHLGNFQSSALSVFNLLFFILPFVQGWSILILLQPLLAGMFTYLFTRELGISRIASLISGIAFMFCGFIVVWMAYGTLSFAIIFLPLALFAVEKYFKTKNILFLILLFLSIPLSLFSGHFQTSLYFLIFLFLYLIYKTFLIKEFKSAFYILLSILFGLFLSMPQLFPSIEFYKNSVRSQIYLSGGIPYYYLINLFSPDFFGNPVTRNDWFGFYAEWGSFVGTVPFILSVIAAFNYKKIKNKFFIFSSILFLVLAIDSPLQRILALLKIPVLSTSNASRIIVLASFSLAILAGLGLDAVVDFIKEKKYKNLIFPIILVLFLFGFVWLRLLVFKVFPHGAFVIAVRNFILPNFIFLLFLAFLILLYFKNNFILFFTLFLLLITSFESLRFAKKWLPFENKASVFPNVNVISALQKNIGFGRYFGNLGGQIAVYYRLSSIEGYDPLYIGRYGEFIMSAEDGIFHPGERSVARISRNAKYISRVLDLLGVTVIFNPVADTNQGWAFPVWKDDRFKLIYKDDKFQLFKNTTALPRAGLFYNYEIIKDKKEIIKRFYSDNFDFRKNLILERKPLYMKAEGNPRGSGSAVITSYLPDKIEVKVSTDKPVLLFLSDNFYPGWKAFVDNRQEPILSADFSFRAVALDKGEHVVKFEYQPESFRLGLYFAALGILGMGAVVLFVDKYDFKP